MSAHTDSSGLTFTCAGQNSVAQFSALTTAYLGMRRETGALLKQLLTDDPDMPMALCAKGYFCKLLANSKQSDRAKKIAIDLAQRVQSLELDIREKKHIAALGAWCNGQLDQATALWEEILLDHPLDALALRLAHYMHFYLGDGENMRDSVARVLPHWSEEQVDYGYVLGMQAFGFEETGDFAKAEQLGRLASEINPADAWSVHAVAHVMEMNGRYREGVEWVQGLESDWSTTNNFRFHLYWHQSLYYLEQGDYSAALELFDRQIASDIENDFNLDMCNAVSLLVRLQLHGVDVGERWHSLLAIAETHVEDDDMVFISLHYLMAALWNKQSELVKRFMQCFGRWSRENTTQGEIAARIGFGLARGLEWAQQGAHQKTITALMPLCQIWNEVGGSKAQMDLFSMVLLDAYAHAADPAEAKRIFARMEKEKSHSRWFWQQYSTVLQRTGDESEAVKAQQIAEQLASN